MKKLLLGSAILTLFAIAITFLQISCQKNVDAQSTSTTSTTTAQQLDISLISTSQILAVGSSIDSLGNTAVVKRAVQVFYIVNNKTSSAIKINITMPSGQYPSGNAALSPDGKKLIFESTTLNYQNSIYSVLIDGSSLTKIIDGNYILKGTY